jgi:eukaryotic-like serine/threonine-protein kinase
MDDEIPRKSLNHELDKGVDAVAPDAADQHNDKEALNDSEAAADPLRLKDGSVIAGRYKVLSKIGQGGMGAIYKVEQSALGSVQALKVLDARKTSSRNYVRFQKEARGLHRLNHRNLIRVYDFGLLDDGRPYLVMDYADGKSLHEMIKRSGRLSISETTEIFMQVCDGVGYAHEHNIIHRDLKPSNIMLMVDAAGDTVIKIVDFGIAKFVEADNEQGLTHTGEIFGSPFYMSPEQGLGLAIDHRSDIYACGCALFETLTGVTPFSSVAALHTMMKHQTEKPPTLREVTLGEDFPQALEDLVAKLLAKEPKDRHQSMAQLKHDLQLVQAGRELDAKAPVKVEKVDVQRYLTIASVACVCLLVVIGWTTFAIFNKKQPAVSLPPAKLEDGMASSFKDLAQHDGVVATSSKDIDSQAYSVDYRKFFAAVPLKDAKDRGWDLEFPDRSLGIISLPAERTAKTEGTKAHGHVHFSRAEPLSFTPNWEACEKQHVFRHFRSDELYELNLGHNAAVTDDLYLSLQHLTGLRVLRVEYTDTSDEGFAHIDSLPSLIDLRLTNTSVTGAGLARMKSIKTVLLLQASAIRNASKAVAALVGSHVLNALNLRRDHLTDNDMEKLGQIQSITLLYVGNNPDVTNKGISYLANLKKLNELDVWDCHITPSSIQYFEQMKALRKLHLNLAEWSDKDRRALVNAIPQCRLYVEPAIEMN